MPEIGLREAKAHLSKLIDRVEGDEVLTLTRNGKPVARIVPVAERRPGISGPPRNFGSTRLN